MSEEDLTWVLELKADVLTCAKNLCWMAERVHQSYHQDQLGTWRECPQGVCGSMEHMLAQVGFDKHLKPREKVP